MNTTALLTAYGAALALLVAGAYAVGTAVGPLSGAGACGRGDSHSGTRRGTGDRPARRAGSSRGGRTPAPTALTPPAGTRTDGRPAAELPLLLGAYRHHVALRAGDPAHLHVHPTTGHPGPDVGFAAAAPGAGSYRLFPFTPTTAGREGRTDGHGR